MSTGPATALQPDEVGDYLRETRVLVDGAIDRIIPSGTRYDATLYDIARDYPLREGKGLRPALVMATCRALGGHTEAAMPTAAVFEMYHNAFLIHDDVEDESLVRRGKPTLHQLHGNAIAVNVGDALLGLCLEPLLDNTKLIGLGKSLRVLRIISQVARFSAEGQATELAWIRQKTWDVGERDYLRMVHLKTTWYSFLGPMLAGAVIAGASAELQFRIRLFATQIGAAFQIQDDALNLMEQTSGYGKEMYGDLWEGKRTLCLLHVLRHSSEADRRRIAEILARPRSATRGNPMPAKSEMDVLWLREQMMRHGSVQHARERAIRWTNRATRSLEGLAKSLPSSVHIDFLRGVVGYVLARQR